MVETQLQVSAYMAQVNSKLLDSMVENSILYAPMAETKIVCLPGLQSTPNRRLFQNPQIPIASGNDIIHTPEHFLSGVYYDNCDYHIFARERKLYPMSVHLN